MIAELDATPDVMTGAVQPRVWRSYAWGIDLSGSEQGAGGVGGLLLVHEQTPAFGSVAASTRTYAPCYDHNGNVLAYVDCVTGLITQRFEYDAFGRETGVASMLVTGSSTSQEAPPMRFSTKYVDEETRLSYYGYRYYSAEMGRWLNRDPIAETGGVNLYEMVGNDVVNAFDRLGLLEQRVDMYWMEPHSVVVAIRRIAIVDYECDPTLPSLKVTGVRWEDGGENMSGLSFSIAWINFSAYDHLDYTVGKVWPEDDGKVQKMEVFVHWGSELGIGASISRGFFSWDTPDASDQVTTVSSVILSCSKGCKK